MQVLEPCQKMQRAEPSKARLEPCQNAAAGAVVKGAAGAVPGGGGEGRERRFPRAVPRAREEITGVTERPSS